MLFACDCGGGTDEPDPAPLVAEPGRVDLGRVAVGLATRREVQLKNQTGGVVALYGVEPSLELQGVVRIDAVPAAIPAAWTVPIQVVFLPEVRGTYEGSIHIRSSVGDVELPAAGAGFEARLSVEPTRIRFGEVRVGSTSTRAVTVQNVGDGPVQLTAVSGDINTSPDFSADLPGQRTLLAGASTSVTVAFRPTSSGARSGRLVFATAEGKAPDAPAVLVEGQGRAADLRVEPVMLQFGGVLLGDGRTLTFELRNVAARPATITALAIPPGPYSIAEAPPRPFTLASGQASLISVNFFPAALGPAGTVLEIFADALEQPLPVALEGRADPSPRPSLWIEGIDFGPIGFGGSVERSVWLINQGSAPAEVTVAIEPAGSPFTLSGPEPPSALLGGEGHRLYVTARPEALGPSEAELVVTAQAAVDPERRVPLRLSGSALALPALVVEPELNFGRVDRGETVRRRLDLVNAGGVPLQIDGLVLSDRRFNFEATELPTTIAARSRVPLLITYSDPLGPAQRRPGSLLLTSNDPRAPSTMVILRAETVEPALIPDNLEVRMTVEAGQGDLDLHLLTSGARLYDAPGDACACNPEPDWAATGVTGDDPRFGSDEAAGGVERVALSFPGFNEYAVWVHYREGSEPATVRVEVEGGSQSWGSERRMLLPGEATALLRIRPNAFAAERMLQPTVIPSRSECY